MASDSHTSGSKRFNEAREELRDRSLPTVDVADLLDYIDQLESDGYHGYISLEPYKRVDEVIFDVALHVGYECGLRDANDE